VRDGPTHNDTRLLRKADLLRDELGLDVRVTVARPVVTPISEPSGSGGVTIARAKIK
jgi:hypothetical protein